MLKEKQIQKALNMNWPPVEKYYYCDDHVCIIHGDCRQVLPQLPTESVEMLWSDPPYGHSNHDGDLNASLNQKRMLESQPIANDNMEEFKAIFDFAMVEAARFLRRDCCCCCCCGGGGPKPTFAWVANRMDTNGLSFFHSVIWDKVNPGLGWRFRRQHEMVMVAHRDGGKLSWVDNKFATPNIIRQYPPRKRMHPNEKPIDLVTRFISATCPVGGLVVDPFMGSGTTLRAAKDLNRKAIGIEIEEKYCEIAAQRMAQEVLLL